jgi:hypothetical protein
MKKQKGKTKFGPAGKREVHREMKAYKQGKLHSGSKSGPKVKSRKQAIAIALSKGRKTESRSKRAK